MPIKFKCSCGRDLDVPESSAGRQVFCPSCRKSVLVPAAPELGASRPTDEREASEFKPGALASLLSGGATDATGGDPAKRPAAPAGRSEGPAPSPAAEPEAKPESKPGAEPEVKSEGKPAAGSPGDRPETAPAPKVEVLPGKIKFRCECGQKVAVPVPAPAGAGTCPRCKRSLTIPHVPGVTDRKPRKAARPPTAAHEIRRCSKCGRRIEDPAAQFCPRCGFPMDLKESGGASGSGAKAPAADGADLRNRSALEAARLAAERLRPSTRPVFGPLPPDLPLTPEEPAELGRRLGAFVLDSLPAAAVGAGGYALAGGAGLGSALLPAALAAAGAFMLVNQVIFAALTGGRSLGMLVSGIRVISHEGLPAGFGLLLVRLLAELLLLVGAPLALFDVQRRTLHDLVCGTSVRRTTAF